jgi:ribosomal protein S17E
MTYSSPGKEINHCYIPFMIQVYERNSKNTSKTILVRYFKQFQYRFAGSNLSSVLKLMLFVCLTKRIRFRILTSYMAYGTKERESQGRTTESDTSVFTN